MFSSYISEDDHSLIETSENKEETAVCNSFKMITLTALVLLLISKIRFPTGTPFNQVLNQ